jgi:hypothetical protein
MRSVHRKVLGRFNKIYFYCADPGSFYASEPIYDDMKGEGKDCIWVFDGWCAEKKKGVLDFIEGGVFRDAIDERDTSNSCILIGVQAEFTRSIQMTDLCRDAGFFTICLFDGWSNYLVNFQDQVDQSIRLPDLVFIMDEAAKKDLIREMSPVIGDSSFFEKVIIIGHHGIERTVSMIRNMSEETILGLRCRFNPAGKNLVLIPLGPIEKDFGYLDDGMPFLGFNEFTTLKYFFERMDYRSSKILIKAHPRNDVGTIRSFVSESINSVGYDYEFVDDEDLNNLVAAADEVVGMTSTILVVALKCGRKIKSLQIGRNENAVRISNPHLNGHIIEK